MADPVDQHDGRCCDQGAERAFPWMLKADGCGLVGVSGW
jgi:hypothetical protein